MKNVTNIRKYKLLSPLYDALMGNRMFRNARMKAFSLLDIKTNDRVLLVGVGTGEDIPLLPSHSEIVGIDLSPEMLNKARKKASRAVFMNMDAEALTFENEQFDVVILNLILSVVENPEKALSEAARVLAPDGSILVFDKFLDERQEPTAPRKLLNAVTSLIGTDINRRFDDIMKESSLKVEHQESSVFNGSYKIYVLKK